MSESLTYEALAFPNYVNTKVVMRFPCKKTTCEDSSKPETDFVAEVTLCDLIYVAELARLNTLLVGDTGTGKTQLANDIVWHHFNGTGADGKANRTQGRTNTAPTDDLFVRERVNLEKGVFDSKLNREIDHDRTSRVLNFVDEFNRAPEPLQSYSLDQMDGTFTFGQDSVPLGTDGYSLFICTANKSEMNTEHTGLFDISRAVLNRMHLTIPLDHEKFRKTDADTAAIRSKNPDCRVITPPQQDLSNKIIAANKEITVTAKSCIPEFLLFQYLIENGLRYCAKDKQKEKRGGWPQYCEGCVLFPAPDKFCSTIKQASTRTSKAIISFAVGLDYLMKLKYKLDLAMDPLDLCVEAFSLTAYHGNINDVLLHNEDNQGAPQTAMNTIIEQLKTQIEIIKKYRLQNRTLATKIITYQVGSEQAITLNAADPETENCIKRAQKFAERQKVSFTQSARELKQELQAKGIGTDWITAYNKEGLHV